MKVEKVAENIYTIADFFSVEECNAFIELSEKSGYEAATIETEKGSKVIGQVRNNQRIIYKDESLATKLWHRASGLVPGKIGNSFVIGLNELFRYYKYEPGQRFKRHVDESFIRSENEASYFTLMIYLNDDYTGGETSFDTVNIKSKKGMALIFLHSLGHEGKEVLSGIKYVLRTDIMYKLKPE